MNTTYDISLSSEVYANLIMTLSTGIVWKNLALANTYDNKENLYSSEIFVSANRGMLSFEIVDEIPKEVFINLGYSNELATKYSLRKSLIPQKERSAVIAEYQRALCSINPNTGRPGYNCPQIDASGNIVDNWVEVYSEKNNYYRMLIGLPDLEDTDFVYNTKSVNWPMNVPIHEMTFVQRLEIEESGYLAELIKQNPKKKYLQFVGSRMIDLYSARTADRFDILWMNEVSSQSTIKDEFIDVYNSNKNLVNRVYYTDAYRKYNTQYDSFLALSILLMTIQVMNSKYLEKDITRDFYDVESLRAVYDSYGVPYYNEIPLEYHKRIVKNINHLITYKGSNTVFKDLFKIFDLESMSIYQYYLVKRHKIDENGNPIFIYEKDSDGNNVLSDESFDYSFSKVKLGTDPSLAIADESNTIKYNDIVESDPYWIDDADLKNKLSSEEFNYNETKYIGIQSIFDLMGLTYQNSYAIKLILDNKATLKTLYITSNTGINSSLYDLIIYLGALFCKSKGWEGIITKDLATTTKYLGFNYKDTINTIKSKDYYLKYIEKHPDMKNRLFKYIDKMNITANTTTVNNAIDVVLDLKNFLLEGMRSSQTNDEYFVYRDLYNSLLVSEFVGDAFGITGTKSTTFREVLSKNNSSLYTRYLETSEPNVEMEYVIAAIEKMIPNLSCLRNLCDLDVSTLTSALFKILGYFKSAKAELVGYDIVYMITSRGTTFIRLIDIVKRTGKCLTWINEEYPLIDRFKHMIDKQTFVDNMQTMFSDELEEVLL